MPGVEKKLSISEGVSTVSPTPSTLQIGNLSTYASTTAFETDKGSTPSQGDVFFDSDDTKINLFDGAFWNEVPVYAGIKSFSAEYTAQQQDAILVGNAAGANFKFNLYDITNLKNRSITIINSKSSGQIEIKAASGNAIMSETTALIGPLESVTIVAGEATTWHKTSHGAGYGNYTQLHTANGHGSLATRHRRFTTAVHNHSTAWTYTDSSTSGARFQIKKNSLYQISYLDNDGTGGGQFAIAKNATGLIDAADLGAANRLSGQKVPAAGGNEMAAMSWSGFLGAGEEVNPTTVGASGGNTARCAFSIVELPIHMFLK